MQTTTARSSAFDRFAGAAAMVVGLGGIVYAVLFITLLHKYTKGADAVSALLLMVGGVATTAVLIAVYGRLAPVDPGFALWALVIGALIANNVALRQAAAPVQQGVRESGRAPLPAQVRVAKPQGCG